MTDSAVQEDFLPLAEPYRRELLAHCYRMLGSVHDAEDLVQETYLRAWRAYDRFEGRSSLRTWLYRIATNACLTALETRSRRPLPSGLGAPNADPDDALVQQAEVPWLEPIPDAMVAGAAADPATIVTSRDSIRLALIAALQHLPPRQRAVLILCEVLRWRAAEVAEMLDTTTAAVNSALQRARAQIELAAPSEDAVTEPQTPDQRDLLERYVAAFESYDVNALVHCSPPTRCGRCRRTPAGTRRRPTSAGSSRTSVPPSGPETCGWSRPKRTASLPSGCICGARMLPGVPAPRGDGVGRESATSWRSSTSHCSRRSGCPTGSRSMTDRAATGTGAPRCSSARSATRWAACGSSRAALMSADAVPGWDLSALLGHMNDSLAALQEAEDLGGVALAATERSRRPAGPGRGAAETRLPDGRSLDA